MYLLWWCYLVQVWPFEGSLAGPSSFFVSSCCQKHYKNMGFQHIFLNNKSCAQKSGVIIWSELAFFKRTQLGPDNDPYLDQIMTPQKAFWGEFFFCFKNVLKFLFLQCFMRMNNKLEKWPNKR